MLELFAGSPHLVRGSRPAGCPGPRILALDRTHRGFTYACLEGRERLVECGQVELGTGSTRRHRAEALLSRLRPTLLVLEERFRDTWRDSFTLPTRWVSRGEVRRVFSSTGTTKEEIADELVRRFPELERKRPPGRRQWWMPEDLRMNVFDAVSFALRRSRGEMYVVNIVYVVRGTDASIDSRRWASSLKG